MYRLRARLLLVLGVAVTSGCDAHNSTSSSCDPQTSRVCSSPVAAWCDVENTDGMVARSCGTDAGVSSDFDAGPRDDAGDPTMCPTPTEVMRSFGLSQNVDGGACCYDVVFSCEGRPLVIEGRPRRAGLVSRGDWGPALPVSPTLGIAARRDGATASSS